MPAVAVRRPTRRVKLKVTVAASFSENEKVVPVGVFERLMRATPVARDAISSPTGGRAAFRGQGVPPGGGGGGGGLGWVAFGRGLGFGIGRNGLIGAVGHSPGAFDDEAVVVRRSRRRARRSRSRSGSSRWRSRRSGWRWRLRRPRSSRTRSAPCASPPPPRVPFRVALVSPTPVAAPVVAVGGSTKTHDAPAPPLSRQPPIRAVAPSAESATLVPNSLSPDSPPPVSFPPSWVQVEPERLNTQDAPLAPLS